MACALCASTVDAFLPENWSYAFYHILSYFKFSAFNKITVMNRSGNQYVQALIGSDKVSDNVKSELDRDGYTVLEGVIDLDWLMDLKKAFDAIVHSEGENIALEHHKEDKVTRIANLVNKGTVWEKVWCHPCLMTIANHVFNGDFKISSLNGREALVQGGSQPLHTDWKKGRSDFPRINVLNSIWAIDDLNSENGAPRIVPATHNQKEPPEQSLTNLCSPHPDEVVLQCNAGSVIVFNAHTWHGGTMNKSGERRRVVHAYFTRRDSEQQQNQQYWIKESTLKRLTPAQKWLLDVK